MSVTRVAQQRYVPITNLPKAEEKNAKRFDVDGNGVLDPKEQLAYYADKVGAAPPSSSVSVDEVYRVAGGRQRDDRPLHGYVDADFGLQAGNFNAAGLGAGHVVVQRRVGGYDHVGYDDPSRKEDAYSVLNVALNCDLVDLGKIEGDLKEARLVIARGGFNAEMGSTLAEKLVIPMDVTTEDAKDVWSNSARRMVRAPDRKVLSTSLDMETMWGLSGGRGLSFYAEL